MAKEIEEITRKMQEMILDDESRRELYKERTKRFPNVMEENFDYTKDHWLSLYKKVENSLNNDITFGLEDEIRHKNVMVFILRELQEQIRAEKLANEVLEKAPNNLVALTNLAFIHLYNENTSKLEEVSDHLNNLEKRDDFPQIEAEGKTNVAYCFGRLSFKDYERAIALSKEASDVLPDNYSCLFSIALLHYRCLKNIYDEEKIYKNTKEAIQYLEKIRCAFPHRVDKFVMGRTLTLLGLFKTVPLNTRSQPCGVYFQQALHISPNDRFVLEKCARFYKISGQFEKAEKLFKKAIEINETSFSHHHLGLIYLKKNNPNRSYSTKIKDFSRPQNQLKRIMKYPKNIYHLERNESIDKAEYHFKQALNLSPTNSAVVYDFILLYMYLKEYENARKNCIKFKTNIKIRDISFNLLFGRLYFILAEKENDDEVKEELRDDGTDRFFLAVKSAIELLPFQKKLTDIWGIKEIMIQIYDHGYIEYNTFLLELIESVEELPDNEELYNKLLMDCDKSELSRKIRKLCKNKQYFKAYFCLRFSEVKPNEVDVKLQKEIYVNLAKHFIETEPEQSKEFFRKCYNLCYGFGCETNIEMTSEHSKDDIITNFHYDIYILTSPNSGQLAENIGKNLEKYFDLKVTFGNHDYILGKYKTESLCTILKNSCNIGILLENSKTISEEFLIHTKYAKQTMEDRKPKVGQLFIINNHEDIEIPKHLESFPQLKCQSGSRDDIVNIFNFLCNLH